MAKNTYPKPTRKPGRVSLVIDEFNNLIEDQGIMVRVTPSVICPRRTGEVEDNMNINHDLNCPICHGRSVVDLDHLAQDDWAFIQGITLDKTFTESSRYDMKDAFMTFRSPLRVSYWYKIEIIDFGSQFNELIHKNGKETRDRIRYPALDPEDGNIFALIDGAGDTYELGTDYDINGQYIEWKTARMPPEDRLFSFLYPVLPTFRVLDLPHENRYYYDSDKNPVKVPEQLPQQAHIRWDFMAVGSGSDIAQV